MFALHYTLTLTIHEWFMVHALCIETELGTLHIFNAV